MLSNKNVNFSEMCQVFCSSYFIIMLFSTLLCTTGNTIFEFVYNNTVQEKSMYVYVFVCVHIRVCFCVHFTMSCYNYVVSEYIVYDKYVK